MTLTFEFQMTIKTHKIARLMLSFTGPSLKSGKFQLSYVQKLIKIKMCKQTKIQLWRFFTQFIGILSDFPAQNIMNSSILRNKHYQANIFSCTNNPTVPSKHICGQIRAKNISKKGLFPSLFLSHLTSHGFWPLAPKQLWIHPLLSGPPNLFYPQEFKIAPKAFGIIFLVLVLGCFRSQPAVEMTP